MEYIPYMKKIPYAVANYEEIIDAGYYFVDKTRFIRELEQYKIPVFLRPRRFGKSLWCSILECYYDINRKGRFDALFGDTEIGKYPTSSRNSHLVMRFNFSKIKTSHNYEDIEKEFASECQNTFREFLSAYASYLPDLKMSDLQDGSTGLGRIFSEVRSKGAPPVHLIIDEYDNFTNQLLTSRKDGLYSRMTTGDSFLRTFYKVLKAGTEDQSVARVFITGVLPVTMDDLTSGFNIAQIVTLKDNLLSMLGFTQSEVDRYLDLIFREHGWDERLKEQVRAELQIHYNGYRFLPGAEDTLYNSTILNFYLNDLVISGGKIPERKIDDNVKIDVNWLDRLTGGTEETRILLEKLMFDGELPVDMSMLQDKFNVKQFFRSEFYPLSLFYLGLTTFRDEFTLGFPNLTLKTIFVNYFNTVENISVSEGYTGMFRSFLDDNDWSALFAGYWERYLGQFPAQSFDKVNENFIRSTFYELCNRYLSRHLMFAIEVNLPSGRSDWQAVGRPGSKFDNLAFLIEFKHFPEKDKKKILAKKKPDKEDIEQVSGYAGDLMKQFPWLTINRHVCYTVGHSGFRFFRLD